MSIANPRRLYRPGDIGWSTVSEPDGRFMDDETFAGLFHGDALLAVSGGPSATLEPVLLRSSARRDVLCWQRGETVAFPAELMHFNGVDAPPSRRGRKTLLGLNLISATSRTASGREKIEKQRGCSRQSPLLQYMNTDNT